MAVVRLASSDVVNGASAETIEKIRQGTTKAMRDPNVRQKLVVSHEPKTQSESSRVCFLSPSRISGILYNHFC